LDTNISATDIALRLTCAVAASLIIGINREEHGRPAGLRTTMLVCLAAAGAMLLANRLIDTTGRPGDSFVTMDVMRLPLGILTGVGFIGAGAILHKDNFVLGVTTAATLWFSTVMGLCYGAGEFGLGTVLLAVGATVLWGLRWAEKRWRHRVEATVSVWVEGGSWTEETIRRTLQDAGYTVTPLQAEWMGARRRFRFDVHRHVAGEEPGPPQELVRLAEAGHAKVTWARHP
jgi:putative Mg2+ transporter-C (MgtC) family protein